MLLTKLRIGSSFISRFESFLPFPHLLCSAFSLIFYILGLRRPSNCSQCMFFEYIFLIVVTQGLAVSFWRPPLAGKYLQYAFVYDVCVCMYVCVRVCCRDTECVSDGERVPLPSPMHHTRTCDPKHVSVCSNFIRPNITGCLVEEMHCRLCPCFSGQANTRRSGAPGTLLCFTGTGLKSLYYHQKVVCRGRRLVWWLVDINSNRRVGIIFLWIWDARWMRVHAGKSY